MKKNTNASRPRSIQQLAAESLKKVSGGGLSGPDQCMKQYTLICTQDVTPPTTQEA